MQQFAAPKRDLSTPGQKNDDSGTRWECVWNTHVKHTSDTAGIPLEYSWGTHSVWEYISGLHVEHTWNTKTIFNMCQCMHVMILINVVATMWEDYAHQRSSRYHSGNYMPFRRLAVDTLQTVGLSPDLVLTV